VWSLSLSCDVASASYDGGAVTDSTRESVSDVILSRDVSSVSRKLGFNVQIIKLTRCEFAPFLLAGVGYRLMVGKDDEVARFQHMAEMVYGLVDDQQLADVCAVFLLGRVEFL
jgi:hypothetical protein